MVNAAYWVTRTALLRLQLAYTTVAIVVRFGRTKLS